MIIDGKQIATDIIASLKREVATLPYTPRLTVFTCAPNFETQKFLALKRRKASEAGIALQLIEFDSEVTVPEILLSMKQAHLAADGIVVQLPFPARINMNEVLPAMQPSHDVDVLTYEGSAQPPFPPVVGAIDEIAKRHNITFVGKHVVVIGRGRLVGVPAALYVSKLEPASLTILEKGDQRGQAALAHADIIISGAGVPSLVKPEMVKEGAVIFDAGTSESAGVLVGDIDPEVAKKASYITPVPGGIGPVTVAVLLWNTVHLAKEHRNKKPDMV